MMNNNACMNDNNNAVKYTNLYGGMKLVNVPVNQAGEWSISEKLAGFFGEYLCTGKMLTSKKALVKYELDCLDASLDIAYNCICNMIESDINIATRKDAYRHGYDAIASALYDMGIVTRRRGDWLTTAQYHVFRDAISYNCNNGVFSFVSKAAFRKKVLTAVFTFVVGEVKVKEGMNQKQIDNALQRLNKAILAEKYTHDIK